MNIKTNVSLANYSTIGLGGKASYLTDIENKQDLIEAMGFAQENRLKVLVIGGGSNIIWRDEGFDGLVLVSRIRGFDIDNEHDEGADIIIGSGEDWDLVVDRAVNLGLSGIECLSLIPGTAGATPVQNVGAYGQEIADTLISLEAYDIANNDFLTILNKDCQFSYRNSRFKKEAGRYFILSIRLQLNKGHLNYPLYKSLEHYLKDHHIDDLSPKSIRQAVINIRQAKLPDPKIVKNCGSFFENPIVSQEKYNELINNFSEIVSWPTKDGSVKLSAAWLLEQAGFKNFKDETSGISTWDKQPLILVNDHAASTTELMKVRDQIINQVELKFGVKLEQEPQLLP